MTHATVSRRRHRTESQWRSLLARFAASGLSVSAFCREESIGESSFYHWRSRLGDGKGGVDDSATTSFLDLGPLGTARAGRSRLDLKLDLGDGLILHLVRE